MVGNQITNPDDAYPTLIVNILPEWSFGIFGAVIFGAILSSFVGSLSSTATLFTLDLYKPLFGKNKTSKEIAKIGRKVTIVIGIFVTILAPMIALFPQGLYQVVQEFNGVYNMPLLVLILAGFFAKRVSSLGAKITFLMHILLYGLSKIILSDIHFLYVLSVLFFLDLFILLTFSKYGKTEEFNFDEYDSGLDLNPWKYRHIVGIIVVVTVIATYLLFSPWGLAKI